jgi:hypothetical protein
MLFAKTLMATTALTTVSSVAATPYDYPTANAPFLPYLCDIVLQDSSGKPFQFDLTPVGGINLTISNGGESYMIDACGVTPFVTNLPGSVGTIAPGIQTSQNEVLAIGPPLHSLIDSNNAATGGIRTTFSPAWTASSDGAKCGDWDPLRGRERGRFMVLNHYCNPSMSPGSIKSLGVSESPECVYNFQLESAAACGVNPPSPNITSINSIANPEPQWAPGAGPFADYLCNPVLSTSSGKFFSFNFSALFSSSDYKFTASDGTSYALNVCGYTHSVCTPSYNVRANFGELVAFWPNGSQPPQGTVCSFSNGTVTDCTPPCRTLGEGAPQFSLIDPTNGATGGVIMALEGEIVYADEPKEYQTCGFDAQNNPLYPSVSVNLMCDTTVGKSQLKIQNAVQTQDPTSGACSFVVTATTGAACGI